MKVFIRRAALVLTFSVVAVIAVAQTPAFAPGEVIVKFKGANSTVIGNASRVANSAIGASTTRTITQIGSYRIRIPNGMSVADAVFYYSGLSTVEYAEANYKRDLFFVPNDSLFSQQYGPSIVKGKEAWNLTKGSSSVIVAVIDSGIDKNHEDLKNKLVTGFDFSDNDDDPQFGTGFGGDHGVHVSGIIGAETNNSKGVAGMGFNCKIMPLKIFPNSFAENSAAAIIYAADHGAKVINMSYGGAGESATERNAVNYAWGKGVVLLGAAGNSGVSTKFFPAGFDNVVAVGATNSQDLRADFSNFGTDWVDVGAPGVDIMSTVPGGYANASGTSMASPMTAGVVALMWSIAAPGTTNTQIRAALEATTDPIANGGFRKGRINAFKACSALDPGSATISSVTAVDQWFGVNFTGSASDLTSTDNTSLVVTSTPNVLGHVAGSEIEIGFNGPSSGLRQSDLLVEANGPSGSSGQVFLWDYSTSKYALIKAIALTPTGVKRQKVALPLNLSKYVSGGKMVVGIRAIGPNRLPSNWKGSFDFSIGFVEVNTRPTL